MHRLLSIGLSLAVVGQINATPFSHAPTRVLHLQRTFNLFTVQALASEPLAGPYGNPLLHQKTPRWTILQNIENQQHPSSAPAFGPIFPVDLHGYQDSGVIERLQETVWSHSRSLLVQSKNALIVSLHVSPGTGFHLSIGTEFSGRYSDVGGLIQDHVLEADLADPLLRIGIGKADFRVSGGHSAQETIRNVLNALCHGKIPNDGHLSLDGWLAFEMGDRAIIDASVHTMSEILKYWNSPLGQSVVEALAQGSRSKKYLPQIHTEDLQVLGERLVYAPMDDLPDRSSQKRLLSAQGNLLREVSRRLADHELDGESRRKLLKTHLQLASSLFHALHSNPNNLSAEAFREIAETVRNADELGISYSNLWESSYVQLLTGYVERMLKTGAWDVNSLTPLAIAPSFLLSLNETAVEGLWGRLIQETLKSLAYDPTNGKQNAWAYNHSPGPALLEIWKQLESWGPESLRDIFYRCWIKAALKKNYFGQMADLGAFLDLAGRDLEIAPRIFSLLTTVSEVLDWTLNENVNPWLMIVFALNISQSTPGDGHPDLDLIRFKRLFDQNFNSPSLEKGLAKFSDIREISRSNINFTAENLHQDISDLNRFIHREIHHGLGDHTVALVEARFLFELSGDLAPALALCERFGEKVTRTWRTQMQARIKKGPALEPDPVIQTLFKNLSARTGQPAQVQWLAILSPDDMASLRAQLEKDPLLNDFPKRIADVFEREIPVYQWLFSRFSVDRLSNATHALQVGPKREGPNDGAWPADPAALLSALESKSSPEDVLDAIISLRRALLPYLAGNSHYTLLAHNPGYEQSHGIWSYRGLNVNDPTFLAYQMDEYIKVIEMDVIIRCEENLKKTNGEDYLQKAGFLLSRLISIMELTGMTSQRLSQIREILQSDTLTPTRLELLCHKIAETMQSWNRRMDREYGPWINALAGQIEFSDVKRDILTGMAASIPGYFTLARGNMRTYLEGRMLREDWPQFRLMGLTTDIQAYLKHHDIESKKVKSPRQPGALFFGLGEAVPVPPIEEASEKGANLVHLSNLGLPIPPGFLYSIGTPVNNVMNAVNGDLRRLENGIRTNGWANELGEAFESLTNPLLISIRTAAIFDAPGQLSTVTNVGISMENISALALRIGAWAAWDSYRRFLQEYAMTVLGMDRAEFTELMDDFKQEVNVDKKSQFTALQMADLALRYEQRILDKRGVAAIPDSIWDQVKAIVRAVQRSWESENVKTYRRREKMLREKSPAIIVEAMVPGNYSKNREASADAPALSGAGVAKVGTWAWDEMAGSFAELSQGFDIADGVVTPHHVIVLKNMMPDVHRQLSRILTSLSRQSGTGVHVEYTVQNGKLWVLQERLVPDQGLPLRFSSKSLKNAKLIADGYGLCGDSAKGPMIMMDQIRRDSLYYRPDLIRDLRKIVEKMREKARPEERSHIGLIVITDEATPELSQYLWPEDDVVGFIARIGASGSHQEELGTRLRLTAVAGLDAGSLWSQMEMNPAAGKINFSFYGENIEFKEGDIISLSVEGGEGQVFPGDLPFANSHSFAIPSLNGEDLRRTIRQGEQAA